MATKSDLSPTQWKKLAQAPLLSGFAVSAADPSGFIGLLREAFAGARALSEARESGNELIRCVAEELLTSSGRAEAREGVRTVVQGAGLEQIKERALAALRETTAILDAHAPNDAKPFKEWLLEIARMVAEAGNEDTFLGFGGIRMSSKEKATLSEMSQLLGLGSTETAQA